uniref:Gamma-tubulin complex component n=1 Tax=Trichuris muris TaxID=70415 RepID=A0A5S6QPD2_TRIMR
MQTSNFKEGQRVGIEMEARDVNFLQHNLDALAIQLGGDPKEPSVSAVMNDLLIDSGNAHFPPCSLKERFRLLLGCVADENARLKFLRLYRTLMLSNATTTAAAVDFLAELRTLKEQVATKSVVAMDNNEKAKEGSTLPKPNRKAKSKSAKQPLSSNLAEHVATAPTVSTAKIKCIPKAGKVNLKVNLKRQEQLVSDLLYCLQGVDGKSSVFKFYGGLGCKPDIFVAHVRDVGLRSFVKPFFPVCIDVRCMSNFVERRISAGAVLGEVCQLIRNFLREHVVHCVEWRTLFTNKQLTYQALWFYIQSTERVFRCLAYLCELIDRKRARGGAALHLIESVIDTYAGDPVATPILLHVQKMACNAYFEFLNDWLRVGSFVDVRKEFMINLGAAASVVLRTGSIQEVRSLIPCTSIRHEMCPDFLSPLADKIREAGIFVQILLASGYWDRNGKYSKIEYTPRSDTCILKTQNMCNEISRAFVQYLTDEFDLVNHIASIRYMYFLCRGDWLIDFIDIAENELCLPAENVHIDRLKILFDCAVQGSSLRGYAFLKDVKLCLRRTRIQNIIRYVSRNIVPGTSKKFDRVDENMLLYEAFSIRYEPKWPLSMLFTPFLNTHFEILFRWLMLFKYVDRQLAKAWMLNSDLTVSLFKRMFGVVFDILNMMTTSVIDPLWKELITSVKTKRLTFEELKVQLNETVTLCLEKCFACDESLTETIVHLLSSCLRFQNALRQSKTPEHVLIQKMDAEFKDVLSELRSRLSGENGNDLGYFFSFPASENVASFD